MNRPQRIGEWLREHPVRADLAMLLLLTLLWAAYFWRVLTPNLANQVSLPQGDFSGQFVAFGAYQARRLMAGEVPLWNPYNNGGHPFIADTQAAVFYPPRLLTIVLSARLFGGWSYSTLQGEAIAHFWLASVWMYLFARTVTGSHLGGLVSAIVFAYGGYLTGYPPLQLAILEAGVWLPLALLGIHKASQGDLEAAPRWNMSWLALSALALGISLLAGHPQTSLFGIYIVIAYILHRTARRRLAWFRAIPPIMGVVGLGFGLAAVQIMPGLEYMRLTTRTSYGFEALAGGFPFSDLITLLLPGALTVWSPLYNGIAPLALAGIAVWRREEGARFWLAIILVALGLSFGGSTIIYHAAYLAAPGFALFRGQERAAYGIACGAAILAGLGTGAVQRGGWQQGRLASILGGAALIAWLIAFELLVMGRAFPQADLFGLLQAAFLLALLATLTWIVLGWLPFSSYRFGWGLALAGLIIFDLFSVTIDTNWEPVPAAQRTLLSDIVPVALADEGLFRVDGRLGLGENYGTLVGLQDVRGTSPLRLAALDGYLSLPQYRLHQLLAVKYVFTDWQQLEVPSTIRASTNDGTLNLYLHEINEPFPRAWMAYRVMITPDQAQALGWISDPSFDPRTTVVLQHEPELALPATIPEEASVRVTRYVPEEIELAVRTPTDGILVISEWSYPGWQATVDGLATPIWEADAGLRALPLKAGEHQVVLRYRPLSFAIGAGISVVSALCLIAGLMVGFWQQRTAIAYARV